MKDESIGMLWKKEDTLQLLLFELQSNTKSILKFNEMEEIGAA